jgi:hypothetical protein
VHARIRVLVNLCSSTWRGREGETERERERERRERERNRGGYRAAVVLRPPQVAV